jgi:hypothetical protein
MTLVLDETRGSAVLATAGGRGTGISRWGGEADIALSAGSRAEEEFDRGARGNEGKQIPRLGGSRRKKKMGVNLGNV